jgi:glycosyltransferase involved in cell wall biosynthesis
MKETPASYILWLPSWYPNKTAPFDGDFIQRHAKAAALYNNIHVIKIVGDAKGSVTKSIKIEIEKTNQLTEQIIYFKKNNSRPGKLLATRKSLKLYKKAINDHIRQNGKPLLVHVHVTMKAGLLALGIKRKYKVPFLVSEHWTIYQPQSIEKFQNKNLFFKYFTKKIIKQAKALVTVSEDLEKQIQKLVLPKMYAVIPNVADENFFYHKPNGPGIFTFLHVSNMNYQKNAEAIIESFVLVYKEFTSSRLIMVGPANDRIKEITEETGLMDHSIFFRGEVSYERVAEEFHASNALVLFSRYENQPCVIIESLCSGVPVISTPVGGIPEIINDTNGILVDPSKKNSLTEAMMRMIQNYSHFDQNQIAVSAKNKFSYSVVGKMISDIYRSLLQAGE